MIHSGREKIVGRGPRILVLSLAAWMAIVSSLVLALSWGNPVQRAVLAMAWELILLIAVLAPWLRLTPKHPTIHF